MTRIKGKTAGRDVAFAGALDLSADSVATVSFSASQLLLQDDVVCCRALLKYLYVFVGSQL